MKSPCQNCMDRHKNCHSECFKYSIFKAAEERKKQKISEAFKVENMFLSYQKERVNQHNKRAGTGEYSKK